LAALEKNSTDAHALIHLYLTNFAEAGADRPPLHTPALLLLSY